MSSSSTGLPTLEGPSTISRLDRPGEPTILEALEGLVLLISGAAVAAPMLPGFTLCVPILATVAMLVLVPLLAVAAAAALVTMAAMIPYLLVRSAAAGLRSRRVARTPAVAHVAGPDPR